MTVRVPTDAMRGEILAFCWRLCQNNASRSYPLFHTRAALQKEYARTAVHPGAFKAACYQQGTFQGVVFGFAEEGSRYLQTTGFYVIEGRRGMAERLAVWLAERFAGFTANIGLPAENVTVADALRLQKYRLRQENHYRCYAKTL